MIPTYIFPLQIPIFGFMPSLLTLLHYFKYFQFSLNIASHFLRELLDLVQQLCWQADEATKIKVISLDTISRAALLYGGCCISTLVTKLVERNLASKDE